MNVSDQLFAQYGGSEVVPPVPQQMGLIDDSALRGPFVFGFDETIEWVEADPDRRGPYGITGDQLRVWRQKVAEDTEIVLGPPPPDDLDDRRHLVACESCPPDRRRWRFWFADRCRWCAGEAG